MDAPRRVTRPHTTSGSLRADHMLSFEQRDRQVREAIPLIHGRMPRNRAPRSAGRGTLAVYTEGYAAAAVTATSSDTSRLFHRR